MVYIFKINISKSMCSISSCLTQTEEQLNN